MKIKWIVLACILIAGLVLVMAQAQPVQALLTSLSPKEQLGKDLFFDQNLSLNNNEACAACHAPETGYTGALSEINATGGVYEGSIPGAFGNRKPPSAAYAGDSPILYYDAEAETWVGGMFWDGRATGSTLGDPLAEQAKGPFLNPKEQAIPDAAVLCQKVKDSVYADLFVDVWGSIDCSTTELVSAAYNRIAFSIAAYERSMEVSSYTSKFDGFWAKANTKGLDVTQISMKNWNTYLNLGLETNELKGLALFNTTAQCSGCHTLEAGPAGYPLFTDFTYDNLGIPKNPENPATIANPTWADPGLGGYLISEGYPEEVYSTEIGKFMVPTLRNVGLRPDNKFIKAYGHNAYFKSLNEIVHFYNTRDVGMWPAPETPVNMNNTELGNLGLKSTQEDWIVAFLKTLSDGWKQ